MIDEKIILLEKEANASNICFADDLKQMLRNVIFFDSHAMSDWFMGKVMSVKVLEKNKEIKQMFCLKR